jgi:hypothetical protein
MALADLATWFWSMIAAFGGGVVLVTALAVWIGNWLSTTLENRLKADLDSKLQDARHVQNLEIEILKSVKNTELESLKGVLAENKELIANIARMSSAGYAAPHPRICDAIQDLWKLVLSIKQDCSPYIMIYSVFDPSEYTDLYDKIEELIKADDFSELQSFHDAANLSLDGLRPFYGETLWRLAWVYRAFSGTIALKVIESKKHRSLPSWDRRPDGKGDHLIDTLLLVFSHDELQQVTASRDRSGRAGVDIPLQITKILEARILEEMNQMIFGRKFLEMSMQDIRSIVSTIRESELTL